MVSYIFIFCTWLLLLGLFTDYAICQYLPWVRHKPEPVDADHVLYPALFQKYGEQDPNKLALIEHGGYYPRTYHHSIFKFGYCPPAILKRPFLARRANITMTDIRSSQTNYVYLIQTNASIRFRIQCVVMKILVPRQYLFVRGRFPIYYCQGTLRYVYLLTYQKFDIHEFYLHRNIAMPSHLEFEFYHATPLEKFA